MSKEGIIIEYRGTISFEIIESLLDKLKTLQEFRKLKKGIQKRLYGIFVECIDNIRKYEANNPEFTGNRKPYICLRKLEDEYMIRTGNLIENDKIKALQSRLEKINKQDQKALKASYAETIDQETIPVKEGAGLGLITIALQSQNRIEYSFESMDHQCSYFEMRVLIANGGGN